MDLEGNLKTILQAFERKDQGRWVACRRSMEGRESGLVS